MKILHTSDWHIGKQLHKIDLSEDLELFFDWLIELIEDKKIDVLLVSGDIFDQANPSQASLQQYYNFLKRMISMNCKVILTGGNHDSASVLNAPKLLLEALDITVIGGAPEKISDLFIEVQASDEKIVVAAVPFLKDRDIRKAAPGETYDDKIQQIKDGLKAYFNNINIHYQKHYKGLPYIVMAHLYAQGSHLSESVRDIQIGNQAGVDTGTFGSEPNYVALGHIHKPQTVSTSNNIRYSGSPISLSFSERTDAKTVILMETSGQNFEIQSIQVPKFRDLMRFEGTLDEVEELVKNYKRTPKLESLGEIEVNEKKESLGIRERLDTLMVNNSNDHIRLVKARLNFKDKIRGATDAFEAGTDLADVSPLEMFKKRLDLDGDLENKDELINAFKEILENLNL